MMIEKGEKLSSLMDGELDKDDTKQFLDHLCDDKQLKQRWERYHIISDSMQSRLPHTVHTQFSTSVMAAIESEPTILAPASNPKSTQSDVRASVMKRITGFAIAASVATIAVIGVQSQYQVENPAQVAEIPADSEFVRLAEEKPAVASVTSKAPANINPVIISRSNPGYSNASASSSLSQQRPYHSMSPVIKFDKRLHKYLLDHSQNASGAGVHDIISSARIVTSSHPSAQNNRNIGSTQVQQ